ncbi:MAG: hypothetical protein ACRDKW_01380 [Actinomycetota bacterium]
MLVTGGGTDRAPGSPAAVQRGHGVHVLDRATDDPKPALVRDPGMTYRHGAVAEACAGGDVVECTGATELVFEVVACTGPAGIVCLTGVSSGGRRVAVVGAVNRELVPETDVVFGSVNANAAHYRAGVEALERADAAWLRRLVTRRVPLAQWEEALERRRAT